MFKKSSGALKKLLAEPGDSCTVGDDGRRIFGIGGECVGIVVLVVVRVRVGLAVEALPPHTSLVTVQQSK